MTYAINTLPINKRVRLKIHKSSSSEEDVVASVLLRRIEGEGDDQRVLFVIYPWDQSDIILSRKDGNWVLASNGRKVSLIAWMELNDWKLAEPAES